MTPLIERISSLSIEESRLVVLDQLTEYLIQKSNALEAIHLNFICTHNSRRSQFAQFWSAFFCDQYSLDVKNYSGGTEVTACHPNVVHCLKTLGFEHLPIDIGQKNPIYKYDLGAENEIELYSKLHTDAIQKGSSFAALMCCSEAGESCPFVAGTEIRLSLNYTDPKWSDQSNEAEQAYLDCCFTIASEMQYVYSKFNELKD